MIANDQNGELPELRETNYPTWDKPIEEQFVTTPVTHDTFFELVFQLKKIACAFLLFLLPSILRKQLDVPNLKVSVRRFRDENFQEARADMVYEIPLKENPKKHVKIYVIIEHKSYDDSHTMIQLLNYETQIINAEIDYAKKRGIYTRDFKLPPIILVIFHHGEGVYTGSVELAHEFEKIKGTRKFTIKQQGLVFDLSSKNKEELPHDQNVPELYIALRIMQIILSKNINEILCEENLLEELKPYIEEPECRKFARLLTYYIFDSNRHLTQEGEKQFNQQLQKTFKGVKIMWSPLAERYMAPGIEKGRKEGRKEGIVKGRKEGIAKGRKEGKKEGELEGRIEAIVSILDVKFGEISETARGSLCTVKDLNRLQDLVRFAATCDTFEEFYKKLN
ncbi:MAG: Rpn family recombination-promoting nuclease/putative transposase [Planctomycetaceae bacterium]|jgi:predicted transposase YdaD|nr:Rpn family recombination-promoting nuclease/putative transposase [Planctomycetaceae bacterium]